MMNRLVEGWAPNAEHGTTIWHYHAGISGLGEIFRSLCGDATAKESDLRKGKELPWQAVNVCAVCDTQKVHADEHAPR